MIKILLALLCLQMLAHAEDCKEQNLITEVNSPFQKIPVYDQNGSNTCYAYASAQLVDYQLIRSGAIKRNIHPAWVALTAAKAGYSVGLESSAIKAMEAITTGQNCSYETVSRGLRTWAKKANVTESEILKLLDAYSPILNQIKKKRLAKEEQLLESDYALALKLAIQDHQSCLTGPLWNELLPFLKQLQTLSSAEMLSKLLLPECSKESESLKLPKHKYEFLLDQKNITKRISTKLERFKNPVVVSYCSEVLFNPNYDFKNSTSEKDKKNCQPHASIVVGKKMLAGSCHFLVRNSWGKEFNSSNKKWTCLCKERTTGKFMDNCNVETASNKLYDVEGCWIKADALSNNTSYISTLE